MAQSGTGLVGRAKTTVGVFAVGAHATKSSLVRWVQER
jgi:hypothetical protein